MAEYKLCASLEGHEDDVRSVTFPRSDLIISASRDATVRLWKPLSQNPPTFDDTVISSGTTFVNAVTYFPPTQQYTDGLIFAGGKDTIIEVREPGKAPDQHAERLLIGHTHAVCALDRSVDGGWIVSGSWDSTARIWPIGKWDCSATLEGHEGSVWDVLAFNKDTIITACADKLIRVFDTSGKLLRTIRAHTDVVRALCKIQAGHPSGAEFASASNDGIIKLWRLDGTELGSLHGHENFIYSLVSLPSGELASAGEDRTLRIWNGRECVQTITHPAISVWAVATCMDNGDIVTGASDKKARVFSRSKERQADFQTIAAFEEAVRGSAIPQQQMGEVNKEKLPGPEFLSSKSGKKDGQVVMIRESDGTVGAYSWASATHEWVQVGTVVDAAGSSGRKQTYQGKDYDFVFDVDVEDGKPPLKLPYNLSQNPYEAATKFIQDNELSLNYLDEVANFITRNTQGASLGQNAPAHPTGADPWGQESRYRPGETQPVSTYAPVSRPKVLPQTHFLSIRTANLKTIQKKIEELNAQLQAPIALDPKQIDTLRQLSSQLEKHTASQIPASQIVRSGLEILVGLATSWPPASRLPVLDLLRVLTGASPLVAESISDPNGGTIIEVLQASDAFADKDRPNNAMLAVRTLVNLFETDAGQKLAKDKFDMIHELIKGIAPGEHANRNLSIAIATLYINWAVLATKDSQNAFKMASMSMESLTVILKVEKDAEALYRALVGVGTFLTTGQEIRTAAKEVFSLPTVLARAESQAKEPRVKGVASEIRDLIQ